MRFPEIVYIYLFIVIVGKGEPCSLIDKTLSVFKTTKAKCDPVVTKYKSENKIDLSLENLLCIHEKFKKYRLL